MLLGNQFLYLLLFAGALVPAPASAEPEVSCKNVKNYFERKGMLQLVDIQEQPTSGVYLSILTIGISLLYLMIM